MARRKEKTIRFDCTAAIDKMEKNVMYATLDQSVTVDDVLRATVPQHEIDVLKAAFPYTPNANWRGYDISFWATPHTRCYIAVSVDNMLMPNDRAIGIGVKADSWQENDAAQRVQHVMAQAWEVRFNFDTIRTVVQWMNDNNVSYGWARHYVPSLGSLLPADSPFHKLDGGANFRETHMPHHIATAIRKLPEVITMGLLCGERTIEGKLGGRFRFGEGQWIPWFVA